MKKLTSGLSRRSMLTWAALGVGGLGAVAVSALNRSWFTRDARGEGSWWDRQFRSLDRAGYSEWSRQVGSSFELHTEAGPMPFKLVAVTPLPERGPRPAESKRDRAFLASFEGAPGQAPQGNQTYKVRHASGPLDIFFSAASGSTPRLDAVFN